MGTALGPHFSPASASSRVTASGPAPHGSFRSPGGSCCPSYLALHPGLFQALLHDRSFLDMQGFQERREISSSSFLFFSASFWAEGDVVVIFLPKVFRVSEEHDCLQSRGGQVRTNTSVFPRALTFSWEGRRGGAARRSEPSPRDMGRAHVAASDHQTRPFNLTGCGSVRTTSCGSETGEESVLRSAI